MDNIVVETRHFFKIPYETTDTVKFRALTPTSQVLYMVLCRLANNLADTEGFFYHSIKDLCEKSGLERRTVFLAKKELEQSHYIDIKRGQYVNKKMRSCNYYRINGFTFRVV
jgi:DNA-binding MarR family transcriptional regulator